MIEMNSFNRESKALKVKYFLILNIYQSGWWILGSNVKKFEKMGTKN